jgi:hypothetical protein
MDMERNKSLSVVGKKVYPLQKCMIREIAMTSVNLVPLFFPTEENNNDDGTDFSLCLAYLYDKSAKISPPLRVSNSTVYVPNPYGKVPGCFCALIIPHVIYVQAAYTVKKFIHILFSRKYDCFSLGAAIKILIFDIVQ